MHIAMKTASLDFAKRIGWIVRTRERVIEARFDPASLPDVLTELSVSDESRRRAVTVQVVQRLEDGIVRGVATAPADAFAPGMTVLSAGRHAQTPVSREAFGRLVRLLAGSSPEPASPPKLIEVATDERAIARAEKLRRFFGQPFFAAERYTHRPGVIVPLAESLRVCREILDGVHDAVPTEAFFFTGGIDEIRSQGKSPAVTSP